ncbi:UbiA-like polyprenyltransferase [Desulfobacterales bacterium HSG2]|nr:UbiA-like polyprenyltransferase [Desulfobacterales bacterium HSG2]
MFDRISAFFDKTVVYGRMIKFSHTLFALPFALAAVVLAHRVSPLNARTLFWIIMAMVGARSAAMGFNRLADASIDARNPRTAGREIPSGAISVKEAAVFVSAFALIFILSAAMLSPLCLWLSFPALGVLFAYSYTKRFTWLSHIVLGLAIGMAPAAVWIAMTGTLSAGILVLSLALLTYIAGFDILYACQDTEFDRREKLCSIPAVFGIERAFAISSGLHVVSAICLLSVYWLFDLSAIYLVFAGIIAVLFLVEHRLVNPRNLSKIDIAFFHVNTVISVLVFVAVLSGELLR